MVAEGQIAITGASGHLGRLVAERLLLTAPPQQLRFTSRRPQHLQDLASRGAQVRAADFDDVESLVDAFQNVQKALIISADGPNDVRIRQHRAAVDAAVAAGVRHIVYTSFVNPSPDSLFPFAVAHADTERYIRASGLNYTILRNSQYIENLANGLADSIHTGVLAQPGAHGKVAYISRCDIAAAIVAVLTRPGHEDKTYELTGGEALSLFDIARILSAARGVPVQAIDAPPSAFAQGLRDLGLPAFVIDAVLGLCAASAAGEYAKASPDAVRLIGRKSVSALSYIGDFADVPAAEGR